MSPSVLIREAAADGVNLALSSAGAIKAVGDQAAVNRWLPILREHKPALLAALAHPNLSGVSPEFAVRLSNEDLEDIAAGDIPLGAVQAFEQTAIAREAEDLAEFFEERSAILEFDAHLARPQAELEAAGMTATLARNRGFLWASLRSALLHYPALIAQVPDTSGPVDALPFGVATRCAQEQARGAAGGVQRGA
jgi:hypothetical protein